MFLKIINSIKIKNKNTKIIIDFNFKSVFFNKFRRGVSIININPNTLVIKKLG